MRYSKPKSSFSFKKLAVYSLIGISIAGSVFSVVLSEVQRNPERYSNVGESRTESGYIRILERKPKAKPSISAEFWSSGGQLFTLSCGAKESASVHSCAQIIKPCLQDSIESEHAGWFKSTVTYSPLQNKLFEIFNFKYAKGLSNTVPKETFNMPLALDGSEECVRVPLE